MADERKVKVVLQADIANYRKAMADADRATARAATDIDRHGNKITGSGARMVRSAEVNREAWQTAGTSLAAFGAVGVASLGVSAKAATDWEASWTGVLKTVEGTDDELIALEDALRSMALRMPASAAEIAGVAEAAGQLGVKVTDVAKFTEVMVNLGETTNLSASEAATQLARFSNIMGTATSDADRLGSTIVDLGNNSATTEAEIVDFALRLAAAGKQAGLSEGEILAFGATLSSLGVRAEAGGTAMSKVFYSISDAVIDGSDKLDTYAQIAGVSAEQFRKAYAEDAAGAIAMFVAGLGDVTEAGGSTTALLEELELTDSRLRASLSATAAAGGLLEESLVRQGVAWEANEALVAEAEKRYGTTQAKIEIARNALTELGISIGENLLPLLGTLAEGVTDIASAFADLPDPLKKALTGFGGLTSAVALVTGGMLLALPRIIEVRKAFQTLAVIAPRAATAVRVASIATGALGAGLAIASIAFAAFAQNNSEAKARVEELTGTLDEATGAFTDLTRETVVNNLVSSGAIEAAKKLGIGLDVLTDAALGNASAIDAVQEAEAEYAARREEEILRTRQLSSELEEQGAAWRVVNDAIGDQNEDLNAARGAWADHKAAMGESADATATTTTATEDATDALTDYNEALTEAIDLQREAAGIVLDERAAWRDYKAAIDDATASVEENGRTLSSNTEEGRANQQALDDLVDQVFDWIEAGDAAGVSQEELQGRMNAGRQAFIDAATDMGMSEDAAEDLANQLNLIPENVKPDVEVTGIEAAQRKLDAFVRANSGKTIRIATSYSGGITRASGGPVYGPGTTTSDSIPAMLSNREYVQNAAAHTYWGTPMMDALNQRDLAGVWKALSTRGYASGGAVSAVGASAMPVASASSAMAGDTFVFDGMAFGADVPPEVVAWLKTVGQRARAQRGMVTA